MFRKSILLLVTYLTLFFTAPVFAGPYSVSKKENTAEEQRIYLRCYSGPDFVVVLDKKNWGYYLGAKGSGKKYSSYQKIAEEMCGKNN